MMTFKLLSLLAVFSVFPFVQAIELQSDLALSFYACSNNSYVTGVTSNDADGFTCSEGGPIEVPLTNVGLTYPWTCNGSYSDPIVVGFLTATSENTDPPAQLNSSTYFYSDQQGALSSYSHVPMCTSAAYLNLVLSSTTFNSTDFDCSSSAWTSFDSGSEQVTCTNVTQSATEQTFSYYACPNNSYVTNVTSNDANGFTCSEGDPIEVTYNVLVHVISDINFGSFDSIVIGIITNMTAISQTSSLDSSTYFLSHYTVSASAKYLNLAVTGYNEWLPSNMSNGCSSAVWGEFDTVNHQVYCFPVTQIPTISSSLLDQNYYDDLPSLECPYGFFNSLNGSDGSSTQCEWNSDAKPVFADIFIDAENVIDADNITSTFSCGTNQAALRILGNFTKDVDYFTNLFNDDVDVTARKMLCANVQLDSDYSLVESQNIAMGYNDTINFNCTNVGNYTSTGFLKSITQQTVGSDTNYFYTCLYLVPAVNNSSVNSSSSDGSGNSADCSNTLTSNGNGKYLYGNSNQYKQGSKQNQGNYGNYNQGAQQNQQNSNYGNYNQGAQQNQQNSNYGNYNQGAQQNQQNSNYGNYNQLSKVSVSGIASLLSDAASVNVYLFATLVMSTIFSLAIVFH